MDPRIIFKGFQATSASQAPGHTPFTSSIPIRIHYQALPGSYTLTSTTLRAHLYLALSDPRQSHRI